MNWEKYLPYVELLAEVNNSCIFLVEYNRRFLYTSPNFSTFFGYEINKIKDPSLENNYLEKRIHPDDLEIFATVQKRLVKFWYEQPEKERKDYKHIYEFRVLYSDNQYVKVVSQHQVLEVDEYYNPHIVLGVVDIIPGTNFEGVKFRLINTKTGGIVPFPVRDDLTVNLSKREIEILKMINHGMLSKEISDKLSISIHTVNGHRQNILQKMNKDTTIEAINYARMLGLLD